MKKKTDYTFEVWFPTAYYELHEDTLDWRTWLASRGYAGCYWQLITFENEQPVLLCKYRFPI